MSGESDLGRLLAAMNPRRNAGIYLFCTLAGDAPPATLRPLATFREAEALTVVVEEVDAAAHGLGLAGEFRAAWITLEVHSDLAAVGFLARIATALAAEGIPCNAIAAFHHDHLFVPLDRADDALRTLVLLQAGAASSI